MTILSALHVAVLVLRGESKIAHLYPAPAHNLIIEPFAGAACHSFRHWERQVLLNDLDPVTYSIWRFLTSPKGNLKPKT
jgi:hypothetical protein